MGRLARSAIVVAVLACAFGAVRPAEQVSAAEHDEIGNEGGRTPSEPESIDNICSVLAAAAAETVCRAIFSPG